MTSFPTTNVVLIVAQNDGKFCITDEDAGWYIPGGKAVYGETLEHAAIRESESDANLSCEVKGIYRIEYSYDPNDTFRFRVIYAADPGKPLEELKNTPDEETNGAVWLGYEELLDIVKNPKKNAKKVAAFAHREAESEAKKKERKKMKERFRSDALPSLLAWCKTGTRVFDKSILLSTPGESLISKMTVVNMKFKVQVLIKSTESDSFVMSTANHEADPVKWELPSLELNGIKAFNQVAGDIMEKFKRTLLSFIEEDDVEAKTKISSTAFTLTSIAGIRHEQPHEPEGDGDIIVTYYAETALDIDGVTLEEDYEFMTLEEINELQPAQIDEEVKRCILNVVDARTVPLGFLTWVGTKYSVLN